MIWLTHNSSQLRDLCYPEIEVCLQFKDLHSSIEYNERMTFEIWLATANERALSSIILAAPG